jgi:tRNA G18 (ribose-2'-O)-methylase SpoU
VEGERAIRMVLAAGRIRLESVLLSTARAAGHPDLVEASMAAGAAVYVADQEVFDRIAGFPVHRGALALAGRPPDRSVESVLAGTGPVLVVEGVNDHENLGALFRNAAAFAAAGVVLDPRTADPLYRRSVRVSVGHVLDVPYARSRSWPADLSIVRSAGLRLAALTPAGGVALGDLDGGSTRWAVIVGSEGEGLSRDALDGADVRVGIPMAPGVDSLNVATAAAIALHHLGPLTGRQ